MDRESFERFYLSLAAKFRDYALGTVLNKVGQLLSPSLKHVPAEY